MATIQPSSQALVIGVSRYQHVGSLQPTQDVAGVRDVLASPRYCAYPPERVQVLEEENATRDKILRALDALAASAAHAASRTFFYFSGHGGQAPDGASYLLPVDARKGQFPTTAISARDLSRHLDRCAGEVTVVLDCCHAAGLVRRDVVPDAVAPPEPAPPADTELAGFGDGLRNEIQARRRVVFAASRASSYAYASQDAPYGVFTGHMLDGLRGRASTDGFGVNVQQLYHYVQRHVKASSDDTQHPAFIAHVEEFYSLTRYPARIAPSTVFEQDVFISYDRGDPVVRQWVARQLKPPIERAGRSIWDRDQLGYDKLAVQHAIRTSKYTVVVLTASYLRNQLDEFKATMAILEALKSRTPRFLPLLREDCDVPLAIESFVGLDMRDDNQMQLSDEMDRLIERLTREPHEP